MTDYRQHLPRTVAERYAWGDVEGILWAYSTGRIPALPPTLTTDFAWKCFWGRQLYEDVIRTSGGDNPPDAAAEHEAMRQNLRTQWALPHLRAVNPKTLIDFGAGVGGQACSFAEELPSCDIFCTELTDVGRRIGNEYVARFGSRVLYGGRSNFRNGYGRCDVLNAQEVLEHVFDLDATLDMFRNVLRMDSLLIMSFPFGPWEAGYGWPNIRGHVRLILFDDVEELFADHDLIANDLIVGPMPDGTVLGWTMCAVRYSGAPFGRIDMARHWEALG